MKRITAVILALIMMLSLASCRANINSGGSPTPDKTGNREWKDDLSSVPEVQITVNQAKAVLGETSELLRQMAYGVYTSDMAQLKKAADYLSQFTDYNSEWATYMHYFENLCKAYYDLYVFNCTVEDVQHQIDIYVAGYDCLSDTFKKLVLPLSTSMLIAVKYNVETLALSTVSSDPASSDISSAAPVSSEAPNSTATAEPESKAASAE